MANPDRIDLLWQLLNYAHPRFCVSLQDRYTSLSLLLLPTDMDEDTLTTFKGASDFYGSILLKDIQELITELQKLPPHTRRLAEVKHPFNQPEAIASNDIFEFWSRAELWTLAEASALINGRNPAVVTEKAIKANRSQVTITMKINEMADLLERARKATSLYDPTRPKKLIDWLELKHIELPQNLKDLVLQRSGTSFTLSEENKRLQEKLYALESQPNPFESAKPVVDFEKPIGLRERESLLKLILGMAIKGYGYDPKATKSTGVSEIASDLQLIGLKLNDDTVRKYLNEAKALFSGELNRTE